MLKCLSQCNLTQENVCTKLPFPYRKKRGWEAYRAEWRGWEGGIKWRKKEMILQYGLWYIV